MDRWTALDPLYTLILTSFLSLYKGKFSNTQLHLVVNEVQGEKISSFFSVWYAKCNVLCMNDRHSQTTSCVIRWQLSRAVPVARSHSPSLHDKRRSFTSAISEVRRKRPRPFFYRFNAKYRRPFQVLHSTYGRSKTRWRSLCSIEFNHSQFAQ